MKRFVWSALLNFLLVWPVMAQGEGFVFRGDQIFVDRASHWRNWVYPNTMIIDRSTGIDSTNLFDISVFGIKPKYFSPVKNYVLDRRQFTYLDQVRFDEVTEVQGQITALSNSGLAANIGDGDLTTYWEPAAEDFDQVGLRNWQVEINLGRTVWADSIVVLLPPIEAGGELIVPLIPEEANLVSDLSTELQLEVEKFQRRSALDSLVAGQDLVSPEGDTLVRQGEVLLSSGQRLPRSLQTIRQYNQLGIVAIPVQGEEDLGDPPKLFSVDVSMGKQAGSISSKNYRFDIVGRALVLGTQRRFVFLLEPLDKADFDLDGNPDTPGTFVHFVRITIFDSDFDQKEFLGEGEEGRQLYETLSLQRQGRQVFHRLTAGGFFKKVDEEVYELLAEEEKGPIRYYKRELPRISDVQVWGRGSNLAFHPEARAGGSYEDGGRGSPELATDGVYLSRWMGNSWDRKYSTGSGGEDQLVCCTMWLDLGAVFWINNIHIGMLTTQENSNEGAIYGLHMLGSDGTAVKPLDMRTLEDMHQLEFGLAWSNLVSEIHKDNNTARGRILRESFDLRRLRFFELRNLDPTGLSSGNYSAQGHFNEIQMYGKGYPAEISFFSKPIILLPGVATEDADKVKERRVLSQILWEGEAIVHQFDAFSGQSTEMSEPLDLHPEVALQIQTRTSDIIDSLFTYYEIRGAGTKNESRATIEFIDYDALMELWGEYNAWEALPEERVVRLRPHRSDRDDDGDGQVDEDLIDGIDNDGDKLIDEDGLTGDEGGPNSRGNITLLKHQRRQDDDGDGAEDEDPIDGIDNDGDFLIDEDGKKKAKPRQEPGIEIIPVFAGWSPWSEPYRPTAGENRAQITSPSPRKFLQVRVNFVSTDPQVTVRLKSLQVTLTPPISTDAVGELAVLTNQGIERPVRDLIPPLEDYAPPRDVPPLARQPFSYFIRSAGPDPNVAGVREGFDEILLMTPSRAQLTGVRLGQVQLEESEGNPLRAVETLFLRSFVAAEEDGILRDENGLSLQVHNVGDSLLIRFPESINKGFTPLENAIVELQFRAQTLKPGTEFLSFVRSSTSGAGVFQRVETEGSDATELVNSQTARPTIVHTGNILAEVEVPQVFTPNGDGINDQLKVRFTVLRLRQDRAIKVNFYDLAGRQVASGQPLSGKETGQSGTIHYVWDGKNSAGKQVAPGIYLCRIELEADKKDIRTTRLVSVVY